MKTTIKKFLLRFTYPKMNGISADELSSMLAKKLEYLEQQKERKDSEPKSRPFNPEIVDDEYDRTQDQEFRHGEEREEEI